MPTKQGGLELLQTPVAQELLQSNIPARLAYVWRDGTPRVIPIWFHWNGKEIVLGTPAKAPKTQALKSNSKAWTFFRELAPTYRRDFVVWIHMAKRPETREKRILESIRLLAAGKKLGLK